VFAYGGTPTYNLMLFNGDSGAMTGTIDVGATAAQATTHPDWSPDGSRIVYVRASAAYESGVNNQRFYGGGIDMVSDQGNGSFGAGTTIVPAMAGRNRYYPSFSPDGELLAFNESICAGATPDRTCNADSDPTAKVYVVKPESSASPVELARANAPGKTDTGSALTNSWPKWAPFDFQRTETPGSRVVWMTFSSTRNYGLRTPPAGTSAESVSGSLIWMVAIDPDLAAAGQDPSVAAFALPFQDVASSNHIAQWTEEVVQLL
jgi:Tol biopolymer transport system component